MEPMVLAGDAGCGVEPPARLQSQPKQAQNKGGRTSLGAACAGLMVVALIGCGGRVERPEASGLVGPATPVDWADNAELHREVVLAVDPQALMPTPDLRRGPDQTLVLDLTRNLEAQIAAGDAAGARTTIAHLREAMAVSQDLDAAILREEVANER